MTDAATAHFYGDGCDPPHPELSLACCADCGHAMGVHRTVNILRTPVCTEDDPFEGLCRCIEFRSGYAGA